MKGGRRCIELHGSPATPEGCAKGGRVGGPIGGRNQSLEDKARGGHIAARENMKSGQLTENSYGIPCVTSDGILVKSVTEVTFYEVALALGGEPEYEPMMIDNYTPDFVLGKSVLGLPANTLIELKPMRNWQKIRPNSKQRIAEGVLIVYADEFWS